MAALDARAIDSLADELPAWTVDADRSGIRRSLRFDDFNAAFAFMTRVALLAEAIAHHPEWFNVYGRVDIRLSTHDVGGLSDLDVRMARFVDEIAPAA